VSSPLGQFCRLPKKDPWNLLQSDTATRRGDFRLGVSRLKQPRQNGKIYAENNVIWRLLYGRHLEFVREK